MTYIENIFVCLAVPIMAALLFLPGRQKKSFLFFIAGMLSCLLSAYISTFMTGASGADRVTSAIEIVPAVEEIMKLFPFLFYLLVFEPEKQETAGCMLIAAMGFATLENVCYLISNGSAELQHLLIRGFGAGIMHVNCGAWMETGLCILWSKRWIRAAGTAGLLCADITYHAIFNLLVSQDGITMLVGFFIPLLTIAPALFLYRHTVLSEKVF